MDEAFVDIAAHKKLLRFIARMLVWVLILQQPLDAVSWSGVQVSFQLPQFFSTGTAEAAEIVHVNLRGTGYDLTGVTPQTQTAFFGLRYNRRTRTYFGFSNVTNISSTPLSTPMILVFESFSDPSISLANPDGQTSDGRPYKDFTSLVPGGELAPGAVTGDLVLELNNPNRLPIFFTAKVFANVPAPPPNHPPVANAGPDQTVYVTDTVTLDGSGSTDVDGDRLTFSWAWASTPPDSTATLLNPTSVHPTFVVDKPGAYVLEMVVNDGTVDSTPAWVTITTENSAPTAEAGPDQTVFVGDTVQLDGSGSGDVDGDTLTYEWSLDSIPAGSGASLSDTTAVDPTFAVDKPGTYIVRLVVNDGLADSAPDTVTISTRNSAPVADAGHDRTAYTGDTVRLDGSGSRDADLDPLTYWWSFTTMPEGSRAALSDPAAVDPYFIPDLAGLYVVQLIVNDGALDSAPDTAQVTVTVLDPRDIDNDEDGYTENGGDCDDTNLAVHPGAAELCNGIDDDCDRLIDEGFSFGGLCMKGTGACAREGGWVCAPDGLGTVCGAVPGLPTGEICGNPVDEDCDGQIDDLDICPVNHPPDITSTPVTAATEGQPYAYDVAATDPDLGDSLTYSLPLAPTGMTIDSGTGAIEWTPGEAQIGPHDITVKVEDGRGGLDFQTFIVTANAPNGPPAAEDDLYTTRIGEVLTVPVAGVLANDSDPDGDPLTAELVTNPANGTLNFNADGSLEYRAQTPLNALEAIPVAGDLVQLVEPVVINVSSSAATRPAERAIDGDLSTSWFTLSGDAVNQGGHPFFEIVFPHDVTVTELQMFGNREAANGRDFLAGIFELFDRTGTELFSSGEVILPAPDRDITVPVPSVDGVRRVRFTPTADESGSPGFAELKVFGSTVTRLFKHKTNVELTRFARIDASASSSLSSRPPAFGVDQTLNSSWLSASTDTSPSYEITFPDQSVTVREVRIFGNRTTLGQKANGFDFLSGVFRLLDESGSELWNSGMVDLPLPNRDLVLTVPAVQNVHTVRFEGVTWESTTPGFGELKVFGDGLVWPIFPGLEWSWIETSAPVSGNAHAGHVMAAPVVVDLDEDGFPEIVFSAWTGPAGGTTNPAYLVVLDGRTGAEKQVLTDPSLRVNGPTSMAVGDIDGDGHPEIVAMAEVVSGAYHLIAFEHDLTFKWRSDALEPLTWGGISIADLHADGSPEILAGRQVLDANGSLLWTGSMDSGRAVPVAADIDLDGALEVIVGSTVYRADGTLMWTDPNGRLGWAATGNFDDDAFAEVVVGSTSFIRVYEHDGTLKWVAQTGFGGGPPTVADFDGDGRPEVGQAGSVQYTVVDTNGRVMWQQPIVDSSSGQTGSSVFDFDGDGTAEVVQRDERFFRIYRGADGEVLFQTPVSSATWNELPVVADVDADGHAEVVITATTASTAFERTTGIHVFGGLDQDWVRTRKIWNQHAYHITNVKSDGTIPAVEPNNWLTPGLNNYRQNAYAPDDADRVDSFTYKARAAGQDSNIATVSIDIRPPNSAPEIISTPGTTSTNGFEYLYGVNATDLDNDPLVFALVNAPTGMTIDPATGLLRWTPGDADAGNHPVTVKVTDDDGLSTLQAYILVVGTPIAVPDVIGQPQAAAETAITGVGLSVGTLTQATHPTVPAGSVVDQSPPGGSSVEAGAPVSLVISLGPAPGDIDDDGDGFSENQGDCNDAQATVYPGAADSLGNGIDENCDGGDGVFTLASIVVSPADPILLVGQTQAFTATGVFTDGTSQNLTGLVTWESSLPATASITADGTATGLADGVTTIRATRDGITGSTPLTVRAATPGDTTPPTAAITAPANDTTVTGPVEIIGTASDANFLKYLLEFAPAGETRFTLLAQGSAPVAGGILGTFDPTLLLNDLYTVRLTVYDRGGNQTAASVVYQVDENMKVGLFTLTFTDLTIPMSGLPITVNRTYDSRDKGQGDFGIGWRVDVQTLKVRANRVQGTGWQVNKRGLSYVLAPTDAHKVSLTLPDGRVEEFDLALRPAASAIVPLRAVTASYVPRPGTLGTLVPLDNPNLIILDNQPGEVQLLDDTTFNPYDPQTFRYTRLDGTQIVLHKTTGVQSIKDPNGNTLTFGPNGIIHSAGKSVTFARDAEGRITGITDPAGKVQTYAYDANGDLTGHTDREGNTTRFRYNLRHDLIEIHDPLGNRGVRNEYDADGRLVATVDARGNRIEFTHNLSARQDVIRDRLGNVTVHEYDERGNVVATTDALGNRKEFTYDSRNNLLTEKDPLGRMKSFTYDADNNILAMTDFEGNTTRHTYNARGQELTITDPEGKVTTREYDARGNLVQEIDPEGGITEFSYNAAGNLLTKTDPLGQVTLHTYDRFGHLTSTTDPQGNRITFTYDANGNRSTETRSRSLPDGTTEVLTRQFEYDAAGRQIKEIDPLGNTLNITYDSLGREETATDKNGNVVRLNYDEAGNLVETTFPDGSKQTSTYDAEKREITRTDRDGNTTSFEYDPLGRLTRTIHPDGVSTSTTYDAAGRVVTQTDARGNVTTFSYAPNQQTVTDALGNATVHEFDSSGRRIRMTDARGHRTTLTYDSKGNLLATTFPDGIRQTAAYDAAGRKLSETDRAGRTTWFDYDALGRLIRVTNALGGVTAYTYDEVGHRMSETDAEGRTTRLEYDAVGRLIKRTRPLGETETFSYDPAGNLIAHTDFNGDTTTLAYDSNKRLIRKTLPDGTAVPYAYSPNGLRTQAGGDTYTYDRRGRLLTERKADGNVISYTYDAAGNRTSVTTPQSATAYTYDALNRLATVIDPTGVTTYAYDAVGNRASVAYPTGVATNYIYDNLNRLTGVTNTAPDGAALSSYRYSLGLAGNRLRVEESGSAIPGRTVDYTYDALYRLIAESIADPTAGSRVIAYTFDAVGNRLSKDDSVEGRTTYLYDANHRLLRESGPDGTMSYRYDANGSTVSRTNGVNTDTYTYDFEKRLIAADIRLGPLPGLVSYTYDADGIRTSKTTGGVTTRYLADKNREFAQVLVEETGTGVVTYTYGLERINLTRPGTGTRFYQFDGHHSTRQLTNLTGAVTDTYTYDAFGNLLASTGTTPNDFLYTGEQLDPNVGFYYLRARYYAPALGRFLTPDPLNGSVFDPPSLHRYLYAHADPVNNVDPSGTSIVPVLVVAVVVLVIVGVLVTLGSTHGARARRAAFEAGYYSPDLYRVGTKVKGMVQVKTRGEDRWQQVVSSRRLGPGDAIRTGPDGIAQIRTDIGVAMTMGPNTTLSMEDFDEGALTLLAGVEAEEVATEGAWRRAWRSIREFFNKPKKFEMEAPFSGLAARG